MLPAGRGAAIGGAVEAWQRDGGRIVLASDQAPRLAELLDEAGHPAAVVHTPEAPPPGAVVLIERSLNGGFEGGPDGLVFVTDRELFGTVRVRRPKALRRVVPRRRAFGRRTRTVPNSSRSVTKTRPSGPPSKPPFRLRSMRTTAPGGGASGVWTTAAGWPASSSSSARRGAWSLARTIRPPSRCHASTAPPIAAPRPAGSTRLRQPNMSPELRPRAASAAEFGLLRLPRQLERPARDESRLPRPRPDVGRGPVLRQVAGLDQLRPALVGLAPEELRGLGDIARLVDDQQRVLRDVVEARRWGEQRRPDLRRVADVQRPRLRPAGGEPLEVRGEPLGEPAGPAAQRVAERGHAAVGLEELRCGQEHGLLERPDRPLVRWVEGPQRVDLVAEELDPDGQWRRRREDVDDAAATGKLAATGDLERRRVAQVEQVGEQGVLAQPRPDLEDADVVRQVVGGDRVLDERLDARDEDPGPAGPPRRQRRDARRGLVGDELAPLVGQRRPGLEHRDRDGVAEPRLELLGDAISDLGVAGDPDEPLTGGVDRERRGEVRLRAVRDRRQPDVAARGGQTFAERGQRPGRAEQRRQRAQVGQAAGAGRGSRATPR